MLRGSGEGFPNHWAGDKLGGKVYLRTIEVEHHLNHRELVMASLLLQGALLVSAPVLLFLTVYFVLVPNSIKVSV